MAKDANTRRRQRAPRQSSGYSQKKHGTASFGSGPANHHLIRSDKPVELVLPQISKGLLVFRPFPCLDYADPTNKLLPWRESTDANTQSPWCRRVVGVSFAGTVPDGEKYAFITHLPEWGDQDYSPGTENPYMIAYRRLKKLKTDGQDKVGRVWNPVWSKLIDHRDAAWKRPGDIYLVQAFVFRNIKKNYTAEAGQPLGLSRDSNLPICALSSSAGRALLKMFELPATEVKGASIAAHFKCGDPVGPKAGRFIHVYDQDGTPPKKSFNSIKEGVTEPDDDFKLHAVAVTREYTDTKRKVFDAHLTDEMLEAVFEKAEFWEDLLDCGPMDKFGEIDLGDIIQEHHARLCVRIARAFQAVPDMVRCAWDDHPEFLTDEVEAILNARTSGPVPDDVTPDDLDAVDRAKAGDDDPEEGDDSFDPDDDMDDDAPARNRPDAAIPAQDDDPAEGDDAAEGDEPDEGEEAEGGDEPGDDEPADGDEPADDDDGGDELEADDSGDDPDDDASGDDPDAGGEPEEGDDLDAIRRENAAKRQTATEQKLKDSARKAKELAAKKNAGKKPSDGKTGTKKKVSK